MKLTSKCRKRLGAHVRTLREYQGLSQGDVAKALGLSTNQYVSNIERGIAEPPHYYIRYVIKNLEPEHDFIDYLGHLYAQSIKETL